MSYDPGRVMVPDLLRGLGIEASHEGDAWWACCPLPGHSEKEPSWKVNDLPGNEKNGLHYCFGCKRGGTAFELASDVLGITIGGAVEWVMEKAFGAPRDVHRLVIEVDAIRSPTFRFPPGVIFGPLETWVGPARQFAAKERGITALQVERWGLGYAVDGPLNGRIVLPVRVGRGRPVSYSARTFVGSPKRYLSASGDENPMRGAVFGEHLWPDFANRFANVVCEGALNALAVDRALGPNRLGLCASSLGGSTVHLGQVMRLATFKRILVMTDPDLAGDNVAEKYVAALSRHAEVVRVRLPKGEDANKMPVEELREWIDRGLNATSCDVT